MTECYELCRGEALPRIPIPHDCIVTDIAMEGDDLVLRFEEDADTHEFMQFCHPTARSLVMRIHTFPTDHPRLYRYMTLRHHEGYILTDWDKLPRLLKKCVKAHGEGPAYLTHLVDHCSIMVELCATDSWYIFAYTDRVTIQWIEKEPGPV